MVYMHSCRQNTHALKTFFKMLKMVKIKSWFIEKIKKIKSLDNNLLFS